MTPFHLKSNKPSRSFRDWSIYRPIGSPRRTSSKISSIGKKIRRFSSQFFVCREKTWRNSLEVPSKKTSSNTKEHFSRKISFGLVDRREKMLKKNNLQKNGKCNANVVHVVDDLILALVSERDDGWSFILDSRRERDRETCRSSFAPSMIAR